MLDFKQLSYWEKETYINHSNYLIIGSGIVGLSTAIHLKQREPHKKVTVLERGYLPTGASSKNAGFACIGSPSELLADLKKMPASVVFKTVQKRWEGLNYLRELLGDSAIDYKALGSYELFTDQDQSKFEHCLEHIPELNSELEKITGIPSVFEVDHEICDKSGFQKFNAAIRHNAEGQINTGMMIDNLTQLAQSQGVRILCGIEAKTIEKGHILTNYGKIAFETLAICTNGFAHALLPELDVFPARAQVLVTSPINDLPVKGIYHFDEGYYYFRNIGNRILFGGGRNLDFEGETTTELKTTEEIMNHLEEILRYQILPEHSFEIEHYWAGTMGVGKSKTPIIKSLESNIFCAVRLGGCLLYTSDAADD